MAILMAWPLVFLIADPLIKAKRARGYVDRLQSDGTPAVVQFIATRQWESALYLIEKGANLDLANSHGVSVDYYLNEWKESVFGDHPEGWDKVRAAIAARRAK